MNFLCAETCPQRMDQIAATRLSSTKTDSRWITENRPPLLMPNIQNEDTGWVIANAATQAPPNALCDRATFGSSR